MMGTSGGVIGRGTWDKITDPLHLAGGKAGQWADPYNLLQKAPDAGESAADRAARLAEERQAKVDANIAQINNIYGRQSRQDDINDFLGATRSFYRQSLDDQKDSADRSLRFAMARSGLTGGSASVDANQRLGRDYTQGILNADRLAQQAAANLRSADEQSRLNMITLAQTGADMTNAASQAATSLKSNLEGANGALRTDQLGDVFGNFSDLFAASKAAAAERRGNRDVYQLLYTPGFGAGAPRS